MGKKAKKAKKRRRRQTDAGEKYHISADAINRSTGLDRRSARTVADDIYRIGDDTNYGDVVVVTLDIRKSSIALVNLEDFEQYSEVITDYVCYVVRTCQSKVYRAKVEPKSDGGRTIEECGWFDKFTGDGVLVFWRLPKEPIPEETYYDLSKDSSYEDKLKVYNEKWNETIRIAIEFSIEVIIQFLEHTLPEIRKSCGLLPTDFGMSVGIDAGECLLTEMKASENFQKRCKQYGLEYKEMLPVSLNVTAIGRPIIGATRMVSKAKPYEILINSYPGANLKAALEDPKDKVRQGVEFSLESTFVCTKEYNPVEAYRIVSGHLEHLKRTKTFCDRVKKTREEKAKATSKREDMEPDTKDSESQGDSE